MNPPLSREARIYSALWRKALASPEPLVINLPTWEMALSFRLALYRFLKPYRYNPHLDPELTQISEVLAISSPKRGDGRLVIQQKRSIGLAELALLEVGLSEADLLSPAERDLFLMAEPETPPITTEHRINPFFDRK